jgi:hypothetical protein
VPVLIYVAKHTNTSGELDLGGAGLTAITLFVSGTLIDRTFLKYIGRHCVAILRPAGFSARGNVVIGTGPYFDEIHMDGYRVLPGLTHNAPENELSPWAM